MSYFKKCYICLNTCYFPCDLKMDCNCKFDVHFKCYYRWWSENKTCIICRKQTKNPFRMIEQNIKREINLLGTLVSIFLFIIWIFNSR